MYRRNRGIAVSSRVHDIIKWHLSAHQRRILYFLGGEIVQRDNAGTESASAPLIDGMPWKRRVIAHYANAITSRHRYLMPRLHFMVMSCDICANDRWLDQGCALRRL